MKKKKDVEIVEEHEEEEQRRERTGALKEQSRVDFFINVKLSKKPPTKGKTGSTAGREEKKRARTHRKQNRMIGIASVREEETQKNNNNNNPTDK